MSEPENFLARWTRLKREAERREAQAAARAPAAQDPAQRAEGTPTEPASTVEGSEPTVDLSALPPIEEITATTDIRAYLAPGVPAELTRAALRRAWLADPTIRDFVGIAENQWDFNDPHGIPGFGPLEDAGRLIAQLLGHEQAQIAPPADAPAPEVPEDRTSLPQGPATIGESAPAANEQPQAVAQSETNTPVRAPIAAPQQNDRMQSAPAIPRAHGGALPK